MTTQCQPWRFDPVGAWRAISRHSSTTARSTGLSKSRRLRTERVVVSTSSAVRFSFMGVSMAGKDVGMSDRVTINVDERGIADVRMNRPEKRNALDTAMFTGLRDAGEQLKAMPEVRVVVLSGEGSSFCAGLDFSSFNAMASGERGGGRRRRRRPTRARARRRPAASPTSASRSRGCGRSCRCR